jgi:predicted enzyme related to lactoylglutathione lyase
MPSTVSPVSGVDFVSLPTRDLAAETGSLTLGVIEPEKMGLEYTPSRNAIALHVDDVAAARSALEARGVSFQGETFDTGVCHMAFFSDPDGNALMLHHRYVPREPQA